MAKEALTYDSLGISTLKDKRQMNGISDFLKTSDKCVINQGVGDFASLYDFVARAKELGIENPLLVTKIEEPGSKQKLAATYGYNSTIVHDVVNHLVNDIIVMGALPLCVMDVIVYGSENNEVINTLIKGFAAACRENGCSLVGGETSIQPKVVDEDRYVMATSLCGIVDRDKIIDGKGIQEGDVVLGVASNGVHTNGLTLVRKLIELNPGIEEEKIDGESFISHVMRSHTAYYPAIRELIRGSKAGKIVGMAHITGGGIKGNLSRIIPHGLTAELDLGEIEVPKIFSFIKEKSGNAEMDMLKIYNCGIGLCVVVPKKSAAGVMSHINKFNKCYVIGTIKESETLMSDKVTFINNLKF